MAEIVPLAPHLVERQLAETLEALARYAAEREPPDPQELGWQPVDRDEAGRIVRWAHHGYRASIGYVPGTPEMVYLDYRHEVRAWEMGIGDLAVGLETGALPEPEVVLDWRGEPIDD